MQLLLNICAVLVCLQLRIIDGYADPRPEVIPRLRHSRGSHLRGALSRLNRSLLSLARRDERAVKASSSVANSVYPVTVDLSTFVNIIETRFQTLEDKHATMATQISDHKVKIENLEEDVEKAKTKIGEQAREIANLRDDVNEKQRAIEKLKEDINRREMAAMFTYVSTKKTHDDAEADCVNRGGRLAVLDTDAKLDYVVTYLKPKNQKAWLGAECVGCTLVNDDKWKWKSGAKLSLNHPYWPRNSNGHRLPYDARGDDAMYLALKCYRDCTFINHSKKNVFAYICEKTGSGGK